MAAAYEEFPRQTCTDETPGGLTSRIRSAFPPSPDFTSSRIARNPDYDEQISHKYPVRVRKQPLLPLRGREMFAHACDANPYIPRSLRTLPRNDWIRAPLHGQRRNSRAPDGNKSSESTANSRKHPVIASHALAIQLPIPRPAETFRSCNQTLNTNSRDFTQTSQRDVDICHSSPAAKCATPSCRRGNETSIVKIVVGPDTLARDSQDNSTNIVHVEQLTVSDELVRRCLNWVREVEIAKLYHGLEPVTLSIIHWSD